MKKLLFLSAFVLFTLSSFNTKNKAQEQRDLDYFQYVVYFHCTDGHASGSFSTSSSDPAEWQRIANALCNM